MNSPPSESMAEVAIRQLFNKPIDIKTVVTQRFALIDAAEPRLWAVWSNSEGDVRPFGARKNAFLSTSNYLAS